MSAWRSMLELSRLYQAELLACATRERCLRLIRDPQGCGTCGALAGIHRATCSDWNVAGCYKPGCPADSERAALAAKRAARAAERG